MGLSVKIGSLQKIPQNIIFLCIAFIVLPNFLDDFDKYYIDDMAWFMLLFPCYILSYYLGFIGGLYTAIIVNIYHLFLFMYERFLQLAEIINQEFALHVGVAIVTFFCSIGVGILSEKLKEKQEQLVDLNAKLKQMALYDSLTGLPNRNCFMEKLEKSFKREDTVSLLFIDLDGFKKVNDTYGHEEGDNLLKEIAKRLNLFRDDFTFVSRLGGDEFVVLINGEDREKSINKANGILSMLQIKIHDVPISASIGIALSNHGNTPTSLLRSADMAMYKAKSEGMNSIFLFQPELFSN